MSNSSPNLIKVSSAAGQPMATKSTPQPVPTATGNTSNLNSIITDVDGNNWIVDSVGNATPMGVAAPEHVAPERFTATAGQTTFTLSATPVGAVLGFRNGVPLALAFTNVGAVVTYDPAQNGGMTMDALDWVDFTYEAA